MKNLLLIALVATGFALECPVYECKNLKKKGVCATISKGTVYVNEQACEDNQICDLDRIWEPLSTKKPKNAEFKCISNTKTKLRALADETVDLPNPEEDIDGPDDMVVGASKSTMTPEALEPVSGTTEEEAVDNETSTGSATTKTEETSGNETANTENTETEETMNTPDITEEPKSETPETPETSETTGTPDKPKPETSDKPKPETTDKTETTDKAIVIPALMTEEQWQKFKEEQIKWAKTNLDKEDQEVLKKNLDEYDQLFKNQFKKNNEDSEEEPDSEEKPKEAKNILEMSKQEWLKYKTDLIKWGKTNLDKEDQAVLKENLAENEALLKNVWAKESESEDSSSTDKETDKEEDKETSTTSKPKKDKIFPGPEKLQVSAKSVAGRAQKAKDLAEGSHPKKCEISKDCLLEDGSRTECICGFDGKAYCQPHPFSNEFEGFWKDLKEKGKMTRELYDDWIIAYKYYVPRMSSDECAENFSQIASAQKAMKEAGYDEKDTEDKEEEEEDDEDFGSILTYAVVGLVALWA